MCQQIFLFLKKIWKEAAQHLGTNYYVNFLGRIGSNGFQLKWRFAMDADYSFEVKNIEIWAPAFFKHNNLSVAIVN